MSDDGPIPHTCGDDYDLPCCACDLECERIAEESARREADEAADKENPRPQAGVA